MTIKASPETIFNDVMGRAFALCGEVGVSEFVLKRLEREAETLAKADRAGSLEVRAHIEATRGNYDAADDLYDRALKMGADYVGTRMRYLGMLAATDQIAKVKGVFDRFEEAIRTDPESLRLAVPLLCAAGWIYSGQALGRNLEKMNLPPAGTVSSYDCDVSFSGIQEADVAEAVNVVRNFLRSRGVIPKSIKSMVVPREDGTAVLFYELSVGVSPAAAAELEWDLFAALDEVELVVDRERKVVFALQSNQAIDASH